MNTFDPSTHTATMDGRIVPTVTQVLDVTLPGAVHHAGDWYMERGTAVHAAAAFIARGKSFSVDPQIAGQVAACRMWFAEWRPDVLEVEKTMFSSAYMFAGTADLVCQIDKKVVILDWKASLTEVSRIQLGGYSVLWPAATHGIVVALQDDGRYKSTGLVKLAQYRNEFLADLSNYNQRKRLGLL